MSEMQVLEGKQCLALERLWREVFFEDSDQFTEYYYRIKAKKNIGLAITENDELYVAMLFLTPYTIQIGQVNKILSYIIGVATQEEFRHRGLMQRLLLESFRFMYEKKQPFTYLMPANPNIYTPYQFRYIYDKAILNLKIECDMEAILAGETWYLTGDKSISMSNCIEEKSLEEVTEFANQWLKRFQQVYAVRTKEYYVTQLAESKAQNGGLITIKKDKQLIGFFLYAKEGDVTEIQEAMMLPEYEVYQPWESVEKKPMMMARIIHLQEMLALVRSEVEQTLYFKVKDAYVEENNGIFECIVNQNRSVVKKIKEKKVILQIEKLVVYDYTIEELVEILFGYTGATIPHLLPFNQIFLNEIV